MIYQSDNPREDAKMSYKEQMKMTPKEKANKYLEHKEDFEVICMECGCYNHYYPENDTRVQKAIDVALEEQAKDIFNEVEFNCEEERNDLVNNSDSINLAFNIINKA